MDGAASHLDCSNIIDPVTKSGYWAQCTSFAESSHAISTYLSRGGEQTQEMVGPTLSVSLEFHELFVSSVTCFGPDSEATPSACTQSGEMILMLHCYSPQEVPRTEKSVHLCQALRKNSLKDFGTPLTGGRRRTSQFGKVATYGIFAGHGGVAAAELCARNFVPTLLTDSVLKRDPESAIRNACQALEAFVLAKSALDRAYYGTTLLFTMIRGQDLFIANIGNSRAVLATKDGAQAITQEHDGSNAEEVSRVTHAGGYFQDGKVNNLIPITRSIGDLELKDRKHITFPNRRMTEDIIISVPDIYQRKLSSRDEFLVMATAEVWENLSNNVVVQTIRDSLRRGDAPRMASKRVVQAAASAGAKHHITVMILVFPTSTRGVHDKPVAPVSGRRGSRPSSLKRHSSNAEQELQSMKNAAQVPAFVLAARAQEQNRAAIQTAIPESSPITSPSGQALKSPIATTGADSKREEHFASAPYLSLNRSAGSAGSRLAYRQGHDEQDELSVKHAASKNRSRGPVNRGHTVLGTTVAGPHGQIFNESAPRRHREVTRPPPVVIEQRGQRDRDHGMSPRAKTVMTSRISELTASGATMGRDSSHGFEEPTHGTGQPFDDAPGFADFNSPGPSKVRYREDGTVHGSRFGFWRELGKTFGRRR